MALKLSTVEEALNTGVEKTTIFYGEPIESIREIKSVLGGTLEPSYIEENAYTYVVERLDNEVIIHTWNKTALRRYNNR